MAAGRPGMRVQVRSSATILVFGGGRGVNVTITAEGDATSQLAGAIDIAEAALAS